MARVLVGGDALLGECADVGGGCVGAVLERDGGGDLLAGLVVRDADDGDLDDVGVLVEDLLISRGYTL